MSDQIDPHIPVGAEWNIPQMGDKQAEHWHEFFSIPALSMGIYKLSAGATDPQSPHTEDEAYYIISGKAKIQVENTIYDCSAGKLIFVKKHARHKFIDIEEDLTVLVIFAPAEGSLAK